MTAFIICATGLGMIILRTQQNIWAWFCRAIKKITMKKNIGYWLKLNVLLTVLCGTACSKSNSQKGTDPPPATVDSSVYQADPTVFFFNGTYYLYGTDGMAPDNGIKVFTSTDRKIWNAPQSSADGLALRKQESFGTAGFWAPQVWWYKNVFYMAYVANEQIAIASGTSPLGSFYAKQPISFNQQNIDPYVFIDKDNDGKKYLYHVDISNGNKIYVAAINDSFSAVDPQTRQLCLTATEPWETIQDRVVEGPTVLWHNGWYYLIYSANNYISQNYAVGYATSKSPYGPWAKYAGNPILSMQNTGKPGTGHGDIFYDAGGQMYYVLHTHNSALAVSPRRTAIVKAYFESGSAGDPDRLVMDANSFYYLKTTK